MSPTLVRDLLVAAALCHLDAIGAETGWNEARWTSEHRAQADAIGAFTSACEVDEDWREQAN